ncbi:hypothetical protein GS597_09050 [Synechococcales cyanobacterium C]|uniref:Uncharacterized protein n=1 Tax=Petrachloros mirabilis ULC683 TaxID=2781853 RepID=A0A8K2A779_9CYAN|nr:hypothetical protein [Petrachloros mirabilis]NCJ06649.1 hypothetical protein [Petrachloros mirabilis ULC683]
MSIFAEIRPGTFFDAVAPYFPGRRIPVVSPTPELYVDGDACYAIKPVMSAEQKHRLIELLQSLTPEIPRSQWLASLNAELLGLPIWGLNAIWVGPIRIEMPQGDEDE